MMIHVFYKNRCTIGQLMVVLMFVGGAIFLFTFDGEVSESQATGCCGGGGATLTSFAADSSGDYGSDISMDTEPTNGCCGGEDKVIPSSSNSNDCTCATNCGSSCDSPDDCDGSKTCDTEGGSCCYDSDGNYDCSCSTYCGGKNPRSRCSPTTNPC